MKRHLSVAALGVSMFAAAAVADGHDIALVLPADYKSTYENYFTGDRQNGKQVISLWANEVAVKGARGDGKLPVGSVLIGELTPAVTDADGEPLESALGHLISSGEVKTIVLMERIAGNEARYDDGFSVGDWEFEVFSAAGENLGKDTTACRECHDPYAETEYLFSYEHLAMKAVE